MSVTLYSQPNCQPCKLTKMQLEKLNIEYEVIDVQQDEEAFERVKSLGYNGTPVVELSTGDHWTGYRPDRLRALVSE